MTAPEVDSKTGKKFSLFQKKDKTSEKAKDKPDAKKEKKNKKEKSSKKEDLAIERTNSGSTAEENSVSSLKNIFKMEKKKPRAEYQAEIDELKFELAQTQGSLNDTQRALQDANYKLSRFQQWARSAPSM